MNVVSTLPYPLRNKSLSILFHLVMVVRKVGHCGDMPCFIPLTKHLRDLA
jgi:hypothetical protein